MRILPALLVAATLAQPILRAADEPKPKPAEEKSDSKKDSKEDEASVTDGSVTIGGQEIHYRATAGMLPILDKDNKPTAKVFYIAYTRTNMTDAAARPVMFCFNGGPGSSSVWLHLGAYGPKRVEFPGDGTTPPRPPGRLVPNEHSMLDVTDLVFIDPVSTGYSRAENPDKAAEFYGQDADIQTVAEFIRLYTTREKRWRSPKFLAGESYGVFRACGLANHLQNRFNLYVNGLVLVSGVIDFDTLRSVGLNDTPYLAFLPAMTASAHFHQKLPADLQADFRKAVTEAREFVAGDYARALYLGSTLPAAERTAIVAKVARLTGLSADYVADRNLRVSPTEFRKELLRSEGKIIGRFDARVVSRDGNAAGAGPEFDSSHVLVSGVFSAGMNSYVREELKFEKDLPYEILTSVQPWNFSRRDAYASTAPDLARALKENPHLKVLVQCGWRDLATPPDGILHSFRQLRLPEELQPNILVEEYDAGHMYYLNPADLAKSAKDTRDFIRRTLGE